MQYTRARHIFLGKWLSTPILSSSPNTKHSPDNHRNERKKRKTNSRNSCRQHFIIQKHAHTACTYTRVSLVKLQEFRLDLKAAFGSRAAARLSEIQSTGFSKEALGAVRAVHDGVIVSKKMCALRASRRAGDIWQCSLARLRKAPTTDFSIA